MFLAELPRDCDQAHVQFVQRCREKGIPLDGWQLSSGFTAQPTPRLVRRRRGSEEGQEKKERGREEDGGGGEEEEKEKRKEVVVVEDKRCTLTWNYDRFPDPAKFFSDMSAHGVVVTPNVKPALLLTHPLYSEYQAAGAFLSYRGGGRGGDGEVREGQGRSSTNYHTNYKAKKSKEGQEQDGKCSAEPFVGPWWGGEGSFIDFTNPVGRSLFKRDLTHAIIRIKSRKVDGAEDGGTPSIWADNNEYDSVVLAPSSGTVLACHDSSSSSSTSSSSSSSSSFSALSVALSSSSISSSSSPSLPPPP